MDYRNSAELTRLAAACASHLPDPATAAIAAGPQLESALNDLSDVDREYLVAMAVDDGPSRTADVAARLGKSAQYANTYRGRLLAAGGEMAHAPEFEYAIINEEFNVALAELQAIVKATRCRFAQQAARNADLFAQLGIHAQQPNL